MEGPHQGAEGAELHLEVEEPVVRIPMTELIYILQKVKEKGYLVIIRVGVVSRLRLL